MKAFARRLAVRSVVVAILGGGAVALAATPSPSTSTALAQAKAPSRIQFNRDVRPILSEHCFSCHGPDVQKMKGGLRLDLRDAALGPAKSGKKAIVPGDAPGSELVHRLDSADPDELMPPPEAHKNAWKLRI